MKNIGFPRKVAILGSTGSIGANALKIAQHLKNEIEISVLAAKSNIDLLEAQAHQFHPEIIAVYNKDKALELKRRLPHVKILAGMEGLQEAASHPSVDLVISAMSGTVGILPTVAAIKSGKNIGFANKEVLVSAGAYVMSLVAEMGIHFIPLDSEHNAIFQCLHGQKNEDVRRLILTASGGPFRCFNEEQLQKATLEEALQHPTYKMGPKNTIDSSTLMNKGLEVIEAYFLFGIPVEKIEVVIHPQSVIHSLVEFKDGSILSQLSEPNMLIPIQFAMTYPERKEGLVRPFDFASNSRLDFYPPDINKFACLALAYDALKRGGSLPCYMNAANEVLVERFLNREISWFEIAAKLGRLMAAHQPEKRLDLDKIIEIDGLARNEALKI
jgi:1-deoxy-D-xylulose-5-phosphate reductoisomerase